MYRMNSPLSPSNSITSPSRKYTFRHAIAGQHANAFHAEASEEISAVAMLRAAK